MQSLLAHLLSPRSLTLVLVVIALLAAVMTYKAVGPDWWENVLKNDPSAASKYPSFLTPDTITSISASVVNGIFIAIMTKVYSRVSARARGG